jgi:hypothetical protein
MKKEEYYQSIREIIRSDIESSLSGGGFEPTQRYGSSLCDADLIDLDEKLPQLEVDDIHRVIDEISKDGRKVFGISSSYYSDDVLPTGFNRHRTVKPLEWWSELLVNNFHTVKFIKPYRDGEIAWVNFDLSAAAQSKIASLNKKSKVRRELVRFVSRTKLAWRELAGKCVGKDELLSVVDGKSVALVGNARSLDHGDFGKQIDAHDIVVRFNRVPIVSRASHGYRTTWVATGVPISQQRMSALGASHVLWLSRYRRKIPSETAAVENLYLQPIKDIDSLAERSGVNRPTTGLAVVDLLSSSNARRVTLYGFDFYKSQSSSSHQTIETAPHQFDVEELFVSSLMQRDARFSVVSPSLSSTR